MTNLKELELLPAGAGGSLGPITVGRRSDTVVFHSCQHAAFEYTLELRVTDAPATFEMEFCSERSNHHVGRMKFGYCLVDGVSQSADCFGLKEQASPDDDRVVDRYYFRHDFAPATTPSPAGYRAVRLVLGLDVTDGFDRVRVGDTFIVRVDHPTEQLDVAIQAVFGLQVRAVPFPRTGTALLLKPRSDSAGDRPALPDPIETADGRILWNCRKPALKYEYEIGLRLVDDLVPRLDGGADHPPELIRQMEDANAFDTQRASGAFDAHAGRWVAFAGGQFLGHGTHPRQLRDDVATAAESLGIAKDCILVEYIESATDLT